MTRRAYIDFKLYVDHPDSDQSVCQVTLLPTPEVGESLSPVSVPVEAAPDPALYDALAAKTITPRQLVDLGKRLGNCLLPEGDIRELFRDALKRAGPAGGVRLRLIIAHPPLRTWPWEYIYLGMPGARDSMRGFLLLDPRVSLVRHEALPRPHAAVPAAEGDLTEWRLLLTSALPAKARLLQLDKEIESITTALADFDVEGVRLTCDPVLRDVGRNDLDRATLRPGSADIFHFAGHGMVLREKDPFGPGLRESGSLLLVADKVTKAEQKLDAEDLARMLRRAGVRLAVVGACLSGSRSEQYPWDSVAGALVAGDIPAVIAMQYEVLDEPAISFSNMFYTALASGLTLDEAMSAGRQAMLRQEEPNVEWGVPVLYSRLVNGALFPERMARAGAVADQFRRGVAQTVELIEQGGEVVGLQAKRLKGGISVQQHVQTVNGSVVGIEIGTVDAGGNLRVEQDLGTVTGQVKGLVIDEL